MPSHTTLRGATDEDEATGRAGDGALDEQQALLGVDLVHGQALRGLVLVALDRVGTQLDEVPARGDVRGLVVAGHRLGDLARVDLPVGELDGGVAVLLLGADLGDDAWPGLDDGDRNDPVVLVEDLGHAELLAQYAFGCHLYSPTE